MKTFKSEAISRMVVVTCTQHDLMFSNYNVHKIQDVEINLYKITENNFAAGTTQPYHKKCNVLIYLPHPDACALSITRPSTCTLINFLDAYCKIFSLVPIQTFQLKKQEYVKLKFFIQHSKLKM